MHIKVTSDQSPDGINPQPGKFNARARKQGLEDGQSEIAVLRRVNLMGISGQQLLPEEIAKRIMLCKTWIKKEKTIVAGNGNRLTEGLEVCWTCIECVPDKVWPTKDGEYDITGVVIHGQNATAGETGKLEIEFTPYTRFFQYNRSDGLGPSSSQELLEPTGTPEQRVSKMVEVALV